MTNPEQNQPPKPPKAPTPPKPKPKAPKIHPWPGLSEWKTSSVDRDLPIYSKADIETLYSLMEGLVADAFTLFADRQKAAPDYRAEISARAKRLRKDGHGQ